MCLILGAHLVVTLEMEPGPIGLYWQEPASSDDAVLGRDSARALAHGAVRAEFRARGAGRAVVTAGTDAPCFHAQPACAMPVYIWRLTVTVTTAG